MSWTIPSAEIGSVNPARAGMILVFGLKPAARSRKPRASGDDPKEEVDKRVDA